MEMEQAFTDFRFDFQNANDYGTYTFDVPSRSDYSDRENRLTSELDLSHLTNDEAKPLLKLYHSFSNVFHLPKGLL